MDDLSKRTLQKDADNQDVKKSIDTDHKKMAMRTPLSYVIRGVIFGILLYIINRDAASALTLGLLFMFVSAFVDYCIVFILRKKGAK